MASIRLALALLAAIHCCLAGQLHVHDNGDSFPDEYMVVLESGVEPDISQKVDKVIGDMTGVEIQRRMNIGKRSFLLVKCDGNKVEKLATLKGVDFVESNQLGFVDESSPVSPSELLSQGPPLVRASGNHGNTNSECNTDPVNGEDNWGLVRIAHRSRPDYNTDVYTWGDGDDGTGVDIYILHTGIDLKHPDFEGRAVWGFTASKIKNRNETDVSGQGTHIAGTAAGAKYGVARKANVVAVKVIQDDLSFAISDLIEGVEYVVNRTKQQREEGRTPRAVITIAVSRLVGTSFGLESALVAAHEEGILSVVTAGGNQRDACQYTPARLTEVITVAASDINDTLAFFSNYGPCVDIVAPGLSIIGPVAGTDQYKKMNGLARPPPFVAGMVARYLSTLSDHEAASITPNMLKAVILDQSSKNQMQFSGSEQLGTPNRLLYKECQPPRMNPTTTTPMPSSTTTTATPRSTTTTEKPRSTTEVPTSIDSTDELYKMSLAALILGVVAIIVSLGALILTRFNGGTDTKKEMHDKAELGWGIIKELKPV